MPSDPVVPQHESPQAPPLASVDVERRLMLAFAPLDKRALGIAMGTALALMMSGITMLAMLVDPAQHLPLRLLAEYFAGYSVSPMGIFIGGAWGFATGFVWGWFMAFVRNFVLAIWLMVIRIRVDMATQRDFLDHI